MPGAWAAPAAGRRHGRLGVDTARGHGGPTSQPGLVTLGQVAAQFPDQRTMGERVVGALPHPNERSAMHAAQGVMIPAFYTLDAGKRDRAFATA